MTVVDGASISDDGEALQLDGSLFASHHFTFDYVFDQNSRQIDVYEVRYLFKTTVLISLLLLTCVAAKC